MPSGMGYGAADGLQDVLARLFLEAQFKQKSKMEEARLAEDVRQADMRNAIDQGQLGLGRERVGLDREEFGFRKDRAAVDDKRYDDAAPTRDAELAHTRAVTGELIRKPDAEAADRDFTTTRDKVLHGYNLREIGARNAGQNDAGVGAVVQQGIGPDGKPALLSVNPRTQQATPIQMPEGFQPNRPARPVTGQERRELAFFLRMLEAEKNARKVEGDATTWDAVVQNAPVVGNWLQTPSGRLYTQAQRSFTEGRMRADSGAAVPPQEYESDRKMAFKVAGDDEPTVTQKRGSRLTAMRAQGVRAGRALQEEFGEGVTLDDILKAFAEASPADAAAAKARELIEKYGGGGKK